MTYVLNALRKSGPDNLPRWRLLVGVYLLPCLSLVFIFVGSFSTPLLWVLAAIAAGVAIAFNVSNASRVEAENKRFFYQMIVACLVLVVISLALYLAYGS